MEKTTKKRKKSKRLKRRIGLIAVGGLSFVLTICLSVGATLAWFAGSTGASNDMYMGGPVYVEMAGRGENGYTADTGEGYDHNVNDMADAKWRGGAGTLDIAASNRTTGTAAGQNDGSILLPGQKLLIYSQARVYSTLKESTVDDNAYPSESSGSSNLNTNNGAATYYAGNGRVQTTTTSVLRAKFSINIEFDPSVGFNDFTDKVYAEGYPVQSAEYLGEYGTGITADGTANGSKDIISEVSTVTIDKDGDTSTNTDTFAPILDKAGSGTDGAYAAADYKQALKWDSALGATHYTVTRTYVPTTATSSDATGSDTVGALATEYRGESVVTAEAGRRDAVDQKKLTAGTDYVADNYKDSDGTSHLNATVNYWVKGKTAGGEENDMWQVKYGLSKCVYQWKYVSEEVYKATPAELQLGAPFDGNWNTAGNKSFKNGGSGNGFYGIYVGTATGEESARVVTRSESAAFFKSRTSSYLNSYIEHYVDDYNRDLALKIGSSLTSLEDNLNDSFIKLIGQSSDNIWAGNVAGFSADNAGNIKYDNEDADEPSNTKINASWLYVDPLIGNDTNSGDSASSVGGWWYLVANQPASETEGEFTDKSNGNNTIITENDKVVNSAGTDTGAVTYTDGLPSYNFGTQAVGSNNTATVPADAKSTPVAGATFQRLEDKTVNGDDSLNTTVEGSQTNFFGSNDKRILQAKLYEITPNLTDRLVATNSADGTTTTKVVSVAFPFVNGNFELPGQALTNVFANAKISFQITFQALQAFFPYSNSIDSIPSGTAITGTGKALNIANAIPIYNEAFDYLSWLDTSER